EHVLGARLGAGACGVVYAAVHAASGSPAAVKVLGREMSGSAEAIERFAREARAANLIGHPNIVHVVGIGRLDDGRPYLVIDLLEGSTLDRLVEASGRVAPEDLLDIIDPIGGALAAAHGKGIVHRDLKPSNVMVATSGDQRTVKLLDFGIAKLADAGPVARLTRAGHRVGTPQTMAPEQIRGEDVDARADIYALGVLVFYLLTGRYPFQGASQVELERLHLEAPPPAPSQFAPVPPALDAVVQRCLAKVPDGRFAGADEVLAALRRALGHRRSKSEAVPLRTAGAVYLEIQCRAADELLLELVEDTLDGAERAVRAANLAVPFAGGNALLAARLLPDGAGRAAALAELVELARRLHREAAAALAGYPEVAINVCLHVDEATVKGEEVTGGPITSIARWAPGCALAEPHATARAADAMAGAADRLPVLAAGYSSTRTPTSTS
ncbi:MAG TPA: serine/threonine-protein kinase, partial [Kofleriaceae bacterium]|nr:serine/threonine-protein kinase [Kofleriaceae bacterium]